MKFQTNRPASWQSCMSCGNEVLETDPATRCKLCQGLLEVRHRPPEISPAQLIHRFTERRGGPPGATSSGVWRFREVVLPSAESVVSYPEGNTPLLHRVALDRWAGVEHLLLKHEGHNPTGSFKDRGMTVGVTQALRIGARAVACASTGNTSASLAAYAAQAGLPALVLVPSGGVATGKLAQTLAYGARTLLVRGDFDQCLRMVDQASTKLGVYLLNSINPFRIEGQKTIVFELLQQLSWDAPDWIVFPAGNLGNTAAFGKALAEAHDWGLIARKPRLAAVQAEGAAPFARSFAEGFTRRHRVKAETVATAIKIGDPASYDRAVAAIRETEGVVLSVPDSELLEAKAVIDASGVGCEPASAVTLAGLRRLVQRGDVKPADRVAGILTGHILKDPGLLLRYHQELDPPPPGANRPLEIEPTLEALEAVLSADS
ncbi:MAG TPA: threonine synthase [Gemmatimonadales bacterium]|nr:threonine synthase [Gemmatimonadales bacterium]